MSAEYSVEEVRAQAAKELRGGVYAKTWDMLIDLAERIEADEMAVPVAKIRHFNYHGIARNRFSQEAQMLDGVQELPEGTELFTRPPAQAAQKGWSLFTGTIGGVHVGLHGTKESVEALDAFLATHPHSPDAADSVRVNEVSRVIYDYAQIFGHYLEPDFCEELARAALAAQGQGDAVRCCCGDPSAPDVRHRSDGPCYLGKNGVDYKPPASPAGVPDGWREGLQMVCRKLRKMQDRDALLLLETMLAAPSATPEGGEVGL